MDHHHGAAFFSNALNNIFRGRVSSSTNASRSANALDTTSPTTSAEPLGRSPFVTDEDHEMTSSHDDRTSTGLSSENQAMDEDADMLPLVFAENDAVSRVASATSLPEIAQPSHSSPLSHPTDIQIEAPLAPMTSATPAAPIHPVVDDDARSDTSMPELQSVSDSSSEHDGAYTDYGDDEDMSESERDAEDVEMMHVLHTVYDDDGDSAWSDGEHDDMPPLMDSDMPPLIPVSEGGPASSSHRRPVAVEEVEDPDEPRRRTGPSSNPSQRNRQPGAHLHPHTDNGQPQQPHGHHHHANPHGHHDPYIHTHFPTFLPPVQGTAGPRAGGAPGQGPTLPSLRTLFPLASAAFAPFDAQMRGQGAPQAGDATPNANALPDMVHVTIDMTSVPWPPQPAQTAGQPQAQGNAPTDANGQPQGPHAHHTGAQRGVPLGYFVDTFTLPPLFPQGPVDPAAGGPNAMNPGLTGNAQTGFELLNIPLHELFGMMSDQMPQDQLGGWAAGFLATLFGAVAGRDDDREDPARAKRLVAGLEEVGEGMVQRMKRVEDSDDAGGGGCAICWEPLLDLEGTGDVQEHAPHDHPTPSKLSSAPESTPSSTQDAITSTTDPENAGPSEKPLPRVVALPCSHVFHSACLVPWFTRPKQTTCPSCRFNIDPDNLTYEPAPPRAPRAAPSAAPAHAAAPPAPAPGAPAPVPGAPAPAPAFNVPGAAAAASALVTPADGAAAPTTEHAQAAAGPQPLAQPHTLSPMFTNIFRFPPPVPAHPAAPTTADGVPPPQAHPPQNAGAQPRTQRTTATFPFPQGMFTMPPMTQAQDGSWFAWPPPPGGVPGGNPPASANVAPRVKRPWTLPPSPGPTLRQRVEQREREHGLRCDDVSCGLGPSDEDPEPHTADCVRVGIRPLGASNRRVCAHVFHNACLVSAERVAGWGNEDEDDMKTEKDGMVEVSCPVCRAVGEVPREEWDEGVRALA